MQIHHLLVYETEVFVFEDHTWLGYVGEHKVMAGSFRELIDNLYVSINSPERVRGSIQAGTLYADPPNPIVLNGDWSE